MIRKIQVEQFHPSAESSFDITVYEGLHYNESAPEVFKMHDDFELTALYNCSGKRIVGNSINNFTKQDLFLIGPNLPHLIKVDEPLGSKAICIHFKRDSFGGEFFEQPQTRQIKGLLQRVKLGCSFHGEQVEELMQTMKQLPDLGPFDQMISFLNLLQQMSSITQYKTLCSQGYQPVLKTKEAKRISLIYDYIIDHFDRKLQVEELAALIHVSPSTFYRQFKKSMNKNFSDFVAEVRIGHACKLLIESDDSIAEIAYLSGYQQITHFNRQFKRLTRSTPREFRHNYNGRFR